MQKLWHRLMDVASTNEDERRRGRMVIVLALVVLATVLVTLPGAFFGSNPAQLLIVEFSGAVFYTLALVLARRGHVTVGGFMIIFMMLVGVIGSLNTTRETGAIATTAFLMLPIVAASLVLRPFQIWIVLIVALGGLAARLWMAADTMFANSANYSTFVTMGILLIVVTFLSFLGARVTASALAASQAARYSAERAAVRLEEANGALEVRVRERTASLETALQTLQERETKLLESISENEQQRNTIREMSVPVIPISSTTLIMPLIGAMDSMRLRLVQQGALDALTHSSARLLVLDITGLSVIDSQIAQGLIAVVHAVRLLGAETVLVGIRPEVAQTIVGLGLDLQGIRTASNLSILFDTEAKTILNITA